MGISNPVSYKYWPGFFERKKSPCDGYSTRNYAFGLSIGGTNSFVLEIIPENLIKQRTYQILKAIPRPTGFFQSKASVWVSRSTVLYCRVRWLCPIIPDGPSVITREYLRESDNQPHTSLSDSLSWCAPPVCATWPSHGTSSSRSLSEYLHS